MAAYTTKVGVTVNHGTPTSEVTTDTVLVVEPETGATLRTKGRLYALCEVVPALRAGDEIAHEVVETLRHEYYYDLSAGIEVSLRRAARQADRKAALRLREHRGRLALHLAAVVVVNNELYAVRVGVAQVFLVRRARLFLPGDEPGDLADFVHRTTTRHAASLGTESDLLPTVWRQGLEPSDTIIVASGALVDGLGAEELKSAAVTLHPRAAAEHVRNRAVAEAVPGSHGALFIEVSAATAGASRVAPVAELTRDTDEVAIAETIRVRADTVVSALPRVDTLVTAVLSPVAALIRRVFGVSVELLPKHDVALPRSPDSARARLRRRERAASIAATALIVIGGALGAGSYRDYERARSSGDYSAVVAAAESNVAAAKRAVDAAPRDTDAAVARLDDASRMLTLAAASPIAEASRIAALRADVERLRDQMANVTIDLGKLAQRSFLTQLTATANGVYAADSGAGRLWRLSGEPFTTGALTNGVVLERGQRGLGSPVLVSAEGEALVTIDDQRQVWRAQGNTVADVTPVDAARRWSATTSAAVFGGNLYVLDAQAGQVWKHEGEGPRYGQSFPFLSQPLQQNGARAVAVDGAVWVIDQGGAILQYRRDGLQLTARRVDFQVRWNGEAARATAIQAVDGQRAIYVLDAASRNVVQITRDGRETARATLPRTLPEATAFVVIELPTRGAKVVTAHGAKIVVTALGQ